MEKRRKIILLILLAIGLAIILYPLIAHALEKRELKEAKLEQIEPEISEQVEIATTSLPEIKKPQGSAIASNSGIASWYDYSLEGAPNFSRENATAASRDYPRGSILRVTNIRTGVSTEVRVNDYGPEAWTGRAIDLSSFAFSQIASKSAGLADVSIELLK